MGRTKGYTFRNINNIDEHGMWITVFDAQGTEVEVSVEGLTLGTLKDWIRTHPIDED